MTRVTLSADEELIEQARRKAREMGTTLGDEFRRWLAEYAAGAPKQDSSEGWRSGRQPRAGRR